SRARRRLIVGRGARSSRAARDSDLASTIRVKARSSEVSTGSFIRHEKYQMMSIVTQLCIWPARRIVQGEGDRRMDARKIGFWVSTGLGTAILAFGGINEVTHAQRIVDTMAHLGYPAWLPSLLGTWKLLAVAAILAPGLPRLKEWAYAGVFFDTTGAIASHSVVGDG